MITNKLTKKIEQSTGNEVALTNEEKDFAEKNQLLPAGVNVVLQSFFNEAIIERYNKETDELITKESIEFLQSPVSYLKDNIQEYTFLETPVLDIVSVDAIAVEYDEVFEVYTAMFGLFIQKKYTAEIRAFLDAHYDAEKMQYSMMFAANEGLWEINLPINYLKGFDDSFSIEEMYQFLYSLIFQLIASIK
ncbi:branched-chain amino acid aminotransferase [Psychrobacillus antarcticus]|uniref:branched-chain amino acid aminotransferase n=1 Tax=Psychrobacillus antarcticus TaxID=2879115 RepID=UPI002408515C|nr:branched-chain amino acid aminotransferase [Psychrobacillus antarcticus]